MQSPRARFGTVLALAITLAGGAACGPAALEEKRLTDQCNAVYGFHTPEARACMASGVDHLAMQSH